MDGLEDYFPIGKSYFQGLMLVSFKAGKLVKFSSSIFFFKSSTFGSIPKVPKFPEIFTDPYKNGHLVKHPKKSNFQRYELQ